MNANGSDAADVDADVDADASDAVAAVVKDAVAAVKDDAVAAVAVAVHDDANDACCCCCSDDLTAAAGAVDAATDVDAADLHVHGEHSCCLELSFDPYQRVRLDLDPFLD